MIRVREKVRQNIFLLFVSFSLMTLIVAGQEQSAEEPNQENAAPRPTYNPLRYEEDWSTLRDKSRRKDVFDPIKYIPLRRGREDWYLSIGGEVRPYYEFFENANFGGGEQDENGYLLQRYMLHTDWRLGKNMRVFAQFKSGLVGDQQSRPAPPDVNKADVNQFFVDFNFGVRRAPAPPSENAAQSNEQQSNQSGAINDLNSKPDGLGFLPPRVVLRVGRQEINFGSGRLVSVRNGPNVRQSFDGLRLTVRTGRWRFDGFALRPVEDDRGYLDDNSVSSQTFWGIYATRPFPLLRRGGTIDIYYLGTDRKTVRFDQGAARDIRHTFGLRLAKSETALDYDFEFNYQFGSFGRRRNIRAWQFSPTVGYTFRKISFEPRIAIDGGIVSGDRDPADFDLETFAPPYPRGQYFGLIGVNGPLNIMGFRPSLTLKISKKVNLTASSFSFWRQSTRDGLYNVPGNQLVRTGQISRSRYIGQQPEAELVWRPDQHGELSVGVSGFFTGKFLRETPPDRNIGYFRVRYTFTF